MKAYLFLAIAIATELFGTSMLKASQGFTKLFPTVSTLVAFSVAFYSLSQALQQIPLGIAYAVWSGVGTAITAVIGVLVWKETVSFATVAGILLIIAGVVILNLKGTAH